MTQSLSLLWMGFTVVISCMSCADASKMESTLSHQVISPNEKSLEVPSEAVLPVDKDVKDRTKLNATRYRNWVKEADNGLKREKTFEEITYEVILIPSDYLVLKEFDTQDFSRKELEDLRSESRNKTHFLLRISSEISQFDLAKHDVINQDEYDVRIKYLSFEMHKDLFLEMENGNRIPCSLSTYERSYGLSPKASFSLEFPMNESELGNCRLVYTEKIFNHGTIKFHWKQETLNNLPQLTSNE